MFCDVLWNKTLCFDWLDVVCIQCVLDFCQTVLQRPELKGIEVTLWKCLQTKTAFISFLIFFFFSPVNPFYITITYIYHVLINALSAHMIHINLNMIFYTHVEHSPTKTIYIKYYTPPPPKKKQKSTTNIHTHTNVCGRMHARTHNDCSRNWVLVLVKMEILGEEEGFQFVLPVSVQFQIPCPLTPNKKNIKQSWRNEETNC